MLLVGPSNVVTDWIEQLVLSCRVQVLYCVRTTSLMLDGETVGEAATPPLVFQTGSPVAPLDGSQWR